MESIKESLINGLFAKVLEGFKKWKKWVVECLRVNNKKTPPGDFAALDLKGKVRECLLVPRESCGLIKGSS